MNNPITSYIYASINTGKGDTTILGSFDSAAKSQNFWELWPDRCGPLRIFGVKKWSQMAYAALPPERERAERPFEKQAATKHYTIARSVFAMNQSAVLI